MIIYKPGKTNATTDALSRNPNYQHTTRTLLALSLPAFPIMEDIKKEQAGASELQGIMNSENSAAWTQHDGLLLYQGKIYVPCNSVLKTTLLKEFHNSPGGGHGGIHKTFMRVGANFYWKNMKMDVVDFVKNCVVCQQVKALNVSPYGLLQPLEVPQQIWEELSMDFITHLPSSQGYTTIFVVVDMLSKAAHFGALPTSSMASKVAQLFWDMVGKQHGLPKSIVSDRDSVFLSKFWQDLFHLQGTTLKMSSSYHPQTDGQTEIVNKCIEQYLRCFVSDETHQWHKFLGLGIVELQLLIPFFYWQDSF